MHGEGAQSQELATQVENRDHITAKDCLWIARLVMKHSLVSQNSRRFVLFTCSGVVRVEVLDSQLPKHLTLCQNMGDSVILRLTEWAEGLYRAVKFAKMIIEASMSSQNLSGRSKVSRIHPDQIFRELVPPQNVKHLRSVQLEGIDPAHYSLSP